jgi:hypothetical protein
VLCTPTPTTIIIICIMILSASTIINHHHYHRHCHRYRCAVNFSFISRYGPELFLSVDAVGRTPLHVAAMRGRKLFLEAAVPEALKANTYR